MSLRMLRRLIARAPTVTVPARCLATAADAKKDKKWIPRATVDTEFVVGRRRYENEVCHV